VDQELGREGIGVETAREVIGSDLVREREPNRLDRGIVQPQDVPQLDVADVPIVGLGRDALNELLREVDVDYLDISLPEPVGGRRG
jgi:hypothetical protein